MNRIDFIRERKDTWIELENSVKELDKLTTFSSSDELMSFLRCYRKTAADLSLCRSHFPQDPLNKELNGLVVKAMMHVGSDREGDVSRIRGFFSQTIPALVRKLRFLFIISFLVFSLSTLAGFFLAKLSPYAANVIAGDRYIHMTVRNIKKGDPFAVYKSGLKYAMSGFIMSNNIKVAFTAFALGALWGIGTFFILVFNGLMLGSIAALFSDYNLLLDFWLTVMIHGTLELFAIMVAGAAGLRLGQALFRPGKLTRKDALARFGMEAFKTCIAMVPIFIIAGVLEGYVTPLDLSRPDKLAIQLASILFIVFYLFSPSLFIKKKKHPHPFKPVQKPSPLPADSGIA
ncbi:MAG: stage II sporulation protein M [Chitinispirillaceae bacterium]